jgi:nitroimidazol reductase NimA-like FMN-containing flavoprotein (pyridoxamine 5'-phosphate oxidase superfamily)
MTTAKLDPSDPSDPARDPARDPLLPASTAPLSGTARSTVGRQRDRAATDRAELYRVLDAGFLAHLGVVVDGAPLVLPTLYGREGDAVYLHGSTGARSLRSAAGGVPVCLTVTHVDGLVYARSVFHHSMNYRSAVVHGVARRVTGADARHGLRVVTEHVAPGSWGHARQPTEKEQAATAVLVLSLAEASVKIRRGGPVDDEEDVAAATAWAGVLPLEQRWGTPVPSPDLADSAPHLDVPRHVTGRRAPGDPVRTRD